MSRGALHGAMLGIPSLSLLALGLVTTDSVVNGWSVVDLLAGVITLLVLLLLKIAMANKEKLATHSADLEAVKAAVAATHLTVEAIPDRTAQAMSRVASQMQAALTSVQLGLDERLDRLEARVQDLERKGRR